MKTFRMFTRMQVTVVGLAISVAMGISSCSVTEPDQAPWRNVSAYSWPTNNGTMMRYRVERLDSARIVTSNIEITTESSTKTYLTQAMFRLHTANYSRSLDVFYLPLKDTLVVHGEAFGGDFPLIAPLDKGHTWVSGYNADANPSWQATIIERYSYLQLEGKRYRNVVVVKYQSLDARDKGTYWIRYYAEGQGPIQTIWHRTPPKDLSGNPLPVETQPMERVVLLDTTPANN